MELRDYQVEDLSLLMRHDRFALLHDPACGKTPPVCVYLYWLWAKENVKSYWVMPKPLLKKNREELLRFSEFKPEDITIIDGTPAQRTRQMGSGAKVFLMGFRRFSDDWGTLRTIHPSLDAVVVDEIHMGYGGHESQRTKGFYAAMRKIKRFVAMTGTLINGRLDSAYPTIHVIEPNYYGNHRAFMNFHADFDEYGNVIKWKNHWKLAEIFKKHGIRRTFKEVYGDENKAVVHELADMSPIQRSKYDELKELAMVELDDTFLDGTLPGVNAIRARQIMACPEIFGIGKGEITGKDELLKVNLADHKNTGKPLLIYSALVPEQERIVAMCRKMGFRVGLINGMTVDRAGIDEKFRAGELDIVVGSPETSAVGFNWGHIDHIIFVSLDYKNTNFTQAYRRGIRGVRETSLLVTILEYRDSIDRRIFQIVNRKSADAHKVDQSYELLRLGERIESPPKELNLKERMESIKSRY